MLEAKRWIPHYNQQLNYMSTALITVGFVYLLAANWFLFPKAIQLAIPQALLLLGCVLCAYFRPNTTKGHCFAAFCAVMTGLSLATYGQIYQAGADSFQLFAIWSALLIPWLYFRLASVWLIFDITLLIAFLLAEKQILALNTNNYLICLSLLLTALVIFAQLFSRASRLPLMIIIASICCYMSVSILIQTPFSIGFTGFEEFENAFFFGWVLISFVLPLCIAALFYHYRWPAGLSITTLALAINSSFWIIKTLSEQVEDGAGIIFFTALTVFFWCWLLSRILRFFVPDSFSWASLPAIFGAWMSSILMTISFYAIFDTAWSFGFGCILLLCGFTLLFFQPKTLFVRQLSYAIGLCGQIMLLIYFLFEHHLPEPYILIACQLFILVCSWLITSSQLWRTLQTLAFILIYALTYNDAFIYLLFVPWAVWLVFSSKMNSVSWRRPVACGLLVTAVLIMIFQRINPDSFDQIYVSELLYFDLTQVIALAIIAICTIKAFSYLSVKIVIPFITLSLLLIAYNLLPILAILLALIPISQHQDKPLRFIAMVAMTICLWLLYYSLKMPLIVKGLSIISSGVLLALISYFSSLKLREAKR